MAGERDLGKLLQHMEPVLDDAVYGIAVLAGGTIPEGLFATVHEAEGLTVVAPLAALQAVGLSSERWAKISLTVHSDLAAVGLTAAMAAALAGVGISANVIAGFYHDHILMPWDKRQDAMAALKRLAAHG